MKAIALALPLALCGCATFDGRVIYTPMAPGTLASQPGQPCYKTWDIPNGTAAGCSIIVRDADGALVCKIFYPVSTDGSRVVAIETHNCAGKTLEHQRQEGSL